MMPRESSAGSTRARRWKSTYNGRCLVFHAESTSQSYNKSVGCRVAELSQIYRGGCSCLLMREQRLTCQDAQHQRYVACPLAPVDWKLCEGKF